MGCSLSRSGNRPVKALPGEKGAGWSREVASGHPALTISTRLILGGLVGHFVSMQSRQLGEFW